jgi:hypothetical protein
MSIHRNINAGKISSKTPAPKAPVPQVDREHFADMSRLQRNPKALDRPMSNESDS